MGSRDAFVPPLGIAVPCQARVPPTWFNVAGGPLQVLDSIIIPVVHQEGIEGRVFIVCRRQIIGPEGPIFNLTRQLHLNLHENHTN